MEAVQQPPLADNEDDAQHRVLALPELVRHILSFVRGFKNIQRAMNVCRLWRSELSALLERRALEPWPVLSTTCAINGTIHPLAREAFEQWEDTVDIIPACTLVFVTGMEFEPQQASSFLHALAGELGAYNSKMVLTSGSGVFHPDGSISVREGDDEEAPFRVALQFIPRVQSIRVSTFIESRDLSAVDLTRDAAHSILFGSETPRTEEPKAVIFATRNHFEDACSLAAVLKNDQPDLAIAGGIAMVTAGSLESCGPHLYGVVLSGPAVKAISIMADLEDDAVEQVLARAAEEHAPTLRVCIASIICCVAWFAQQQQAPKNAQTLLTEAFPGLASVGYFGGGELGFLENDDFGVLQRGAGESSRSVVDFRHAIHQHTCVFLLVGFNRSL